jgi:hypothetical protein
MERYIQRLCKLNQGLNNSHWRDYERKEEPNRAHLVLNIDSSSIAMLEMRWHLFSGVGQVIFSHLGVKPEGRKYVKKRRGIWMKISVMGDMT